MNCKKCANIIEEPEEYFPSLCVKCGASLRIDLIQAKINALKEDMKKMELD